jgi:hypothetical protein
MGTRRAFLQDGSPNGIEAVDDVEDGLPVAPELGGDGWCSLATIRCEQDLSSSQDKGVLGASACLKLATFVFGQRSDEERCFHALYHTTLSITFREFALVFS